MDCRQAQEILFQSEGPRPEHLGSADCSEHLRHCSACGRLAQEMLELEESWRALPLPVEADQARVAFLQRLPAQVADQPSLPIRILRQLMARRVAAIAFICLSLGAGSLLLIQAPESQASTDVVERLIDWNLNLTQSSSPAERTRLFAQHAPNLQAELATTELSPHDREFADTLMENGTWLAENHDPVSEVDRFNDLADKLAARIDSAASKKDARRLKRLAESYRRIADLGIHANIDRAVASGALNFDKQRKLEKAILRDSKLADKLGELLERAPHASRRDIRRALDFVPKKTKKGKRKAVKEEPRT